VGKIRKKQPLWLKNYQLPELDAAVLTIAQFCVRYHISPSYLHECWKAGCGPKRTMRGRLVFIRLDDAEAWHTNKGSPGYGYE
jgi:hypothetical protein